MSFDLKWGKVCSVLLLMVLSMSRASTTSPMIKNNEQNGEVYFEDSAQNLVIGNSFLEIQIDRKTGCIANLTNKLTEHQYLSGNLNGPFRVHYNSMATSLWNATSTDLVFVTSDQQVTHYWVEEQSKKNKTLHVRYSYLFSKDGEPSNISVTYSISVFQDEPCTFWYMKMDNYENGVIIEVDFPRFEGLQVIGKNESDDYLLMPRHSGEKINNPIQRFFSNEVVRSIHPAWASMQWMEFGDTNEGLYLASLDKNLSSFTELVFGKYVDVPFIQMSKFPFLTSGEMWISHPYVVGIHIGDWHWSADRYREWLESWCEKPFVPEWIRELPGIRIVRIVDQENKVLRRFNDLPALFDSLQLQLGRPPVLKLDGWWEGGWDTYFPEYNVSDAAGGFKDVIDCIHSKGGKVILYFNGKLTDVKTKTYELYGHEWAVINQEGQEQRERWGTRDFTVNCPSVTAWRDILLDYTLKTIRDFDIDGIYYDQVGCDQAHLCYNPDHNHSTPATAWSEYISFLKFHREAQNALKEDMFYGTEELCDAFLPYFNWGNDWMGEWTNGRFKFLSRLGEYFPELTRYAMPWYITNGIHSGDIPSDVRNRIIPQNFVLGIRFVYTGFDVESIVPYIKMWDSAKDAFYYGRFVDDVGLTLQQLIGLNVVSKIHIGENSTVIALWNDGKYVSSVKVKSNLSMLNLTKEVGTVIDLGVRTGFRDGCASLPFTEREGLLEFEVFNLEPQSATAIQILSTKPVEGVLKVQSLNLSKSEVVKGDNLEIDFTVVDWLTQNFVASVDVTAYASGLTLKGNEIGTGKYRVVVNSQKFDVGTVRAVIIAEKEGYTSDSEERFITIKEQPSTFPIHIIAIILLVAVISAYLWRYWIKARTKT